MAFDGPIQDLIGAWASGILPPRKRQQDSISIAVVPMGEDGELRVLYSYAEAIASMYVTWGAPGQSRTGEFARFVVVKEGKEALKRASMTTKKQLNWAHRALREELKYGGREPISELVFQYRGNIPTTPEDWFMFGNYMSVVRRGALNELWRAYEREPWDEGIWAVLRDAYAEAGFGERINNVQLAPDGSAFELYTEHEQYWIARGLDESWDAIVR